MPVYEYQCMGCHAQSEVIQRFSDAPLQTCEVCGGALKKLISQTSFVLKGSGWYVTDYARAGNPSEKKAEDGEKSDKGEKSETAKSDEKAKDSAKKESSTAADSPAVAPSTAASSSSTPAATAPAPSGS